MSKRVHKIAIGSFEILLNENFEKQGFAVTDIEGLSEYGEHFMGVPGNTTVTLDALVLPGTNPVTLRRDIYEKISGYKRYSLKVYYMEEGSESVAETAVLLKSIKFNIHEVPCSFAIELSRFGAWYGDVKTGELVDIVNAQNKTINLERAVFECKSPISIDLIFKNGAPPGLLSNEDAKIVIETSGGIFIEILMTRIWSVIHSGGLPEGSFIYLNTSQDYSAVLYYYDSFVNLPILGATRNAMITPNLSQNGQIPPLIFKVSVENIPSDIDIDIRVTTRESYLTV